MSPLTMGLKCMPRDLAMGSKYLSRLGFDQINCCMHCEAVNSFFNNR